MFFSHVIYYVADLKLSLLFFNTAFDIETKFIHESGAYAELVTGSTTLAFVAEDFAASNIPGGFKKNSKKEPPVGCEIVFTTQDVNTYYKRALKSGATDIAPPTEKPWGQTVAYVRDPNGILVEIGSPIG